MRAAQIIQFVHLHLLLRLQTINGSALLLHAPSFVSSVLAFLNNFRDRPDTSRLAHVESTHGYLIGRELVGVKDSTTAHQTRVSILFQPFTTNLGTGSVQDSLFIDTGSLDGLNLFLLTRFIVRSRRKTESLPDGCHLGGSQVNLTNKGNVKSLRGKTTQNTNFVSFLFGTVQSVTETVLVQALFETNLGNALLAFPCVVKRVLGALEETKVYKRRTKEEYSGVRYYCVLFQHLHSSIRRWSWSYGSRPFQ